MIDASKPDPLKHKRRWFQFSLRSLLIAVAVFATICAIAIPIVKRTLADFGPGVVGNSYVNETEPTIRASFGTPDRDVPQYEALARVMPASLPSGPIRTLTYTHAQGGTLVVWLCKRGSQWTCFGSCWYRDGVEF